MPTKSIRKFPDGSGGHIGCEPNQVALSKVLNGIAHGECLNPPKSASGRALVNWTLSRITGAWHPSSVDIPGAKLEMLEAGKFKRAGGTMVTFTLPDNIKTAIAILRLESNPPARMKTHRRKPAPTTTRHA
jgi:hypothetical protein